jgi:hypothetical protein
MAPKLDLATLAWKRGRNFRSDDEAQSQRDVR